MTKTERIADRCPSCGNQTLFIGKGGWLTCSWIECKNPCVADTYIRKLESAHRVGKAACELLEQEQTKSGKLATQLQKQRQTIERLSETLQKTIQGCEADGFDMSDERAALEAAAPFRKAGDAQC